jgi:primosomal protein N' (replication factor Y)
MRLVRVAVPVPVLDALTYSVPDEFPAPAVGARVLVPLGRRVMTGVVIEPQLADRGSQSANSSEPRTTNCEPRQVVSIKPITDLLDSEAFLPLDIVTLTMWVAEYYACGAGEAMAAAMPPRAWIESERHARITEIGHARLLVERGLRRDALERLAGDRPVRIDTLAKPGGGLHAALAGLERDGLVTITRPLRGSASAFRTVRVAALTAQGHDVALAGDEGPKLGARQKDAIALLAGTPEGLDAAELARRGIAAPALARLAALGLISLSRRRVERDPFTQCAVLPVSPRPQFVLTAEQTSAYARLRGLANSERFAAAVLHGVTGSGKTELYLRLAQEVQRNGRGVVVLVPEIALTPAVAAAFRSAFGERVAIQHSALSDGERHDQWQRIRRGDVDVVVGTRSAVFAPVSNVGLLVVDEEHDGSYKQEESPRYHGRDVAVMRAHKANALVVLGSATPSMETYHNAQSDKYALIALERRVFDRPMAEVRVIDMRAEYAAAGPDVILSRPLVEAIALRLERHEQSIVLLNRRGFARAVFCRQCASTLECPNCSVSLTVHRAAGRARCHYCNYARGVPNACLHCAGPYLEQVGFGTERVEAEIVERFPGARVARVDRDTIRKRGAIAALLGRFAAGEIDVLVGTQMIAKGHDFPRVTLVGVISADVGLGLADFRAAERTFQLLTQVAGRAGRGAMKGEALVQTIYPEHYSIRHACRQDYAAFYNDEIHFRRSMRYPPAVALINAVVKARTQAAAMQDAGDLVAALRWGGEPYRVLGPAPAPLSRLKGEHRAQFFIKGAHRAAMREALLKVLEDRPEIKRRTIVDVDPMSVL